MGSSVDLSCWGTGVVSRRSSGAAAVAVALGAAFNLIEDSVDAWPALLVFVVGGFAVGYLAESRWLVLSGPLAGMLTNLVWRLAGWTDGHATELPVALVAFLGLLIGTGAVPATLVGMRVGRRRHPNGREGIHTGAIHLLVALLGACWVAAGCSEEDSSRSSSRDDAFSRQGSTTGRYESGSGHDRQVARSNLKPGRQSRTLADGTVIYPASPAESLLQEPSTECAESMVRQLGGDMAIVKTPPKPGLRARFRDARTVIVWVDPGKAPTRCRPRFVHVSGDNRLDPLPPVAKTIDVKRGQARRVAFRLFDQMRSADTVRATAGMDRGPTSPTAKVSIEPRRDAR